MAFPPIPQHEPRYSVGAQAEAPDSITDRGNRRRLRVFAVLFVIASACALVFDFARPPVFQAVALVAVTPGSVTVANRSADSARQEGASSLLSEVQVLTSRPLMEQVANRLRSAGFDLSDLGVDAADRLQKMVVAKTADGTQVIELSASGQAPELLSTLLNTLIDTYREQMLVTHRKSSVEALARVRAEVGRLEDEVAAKRREAEMFRSRTGIVSLERDENDVLSRLKGVSTSINAANDRAAAAEGKLRSLKDALSSGRMALPLKDHPSLVALEQRLSRTREQLREMERGFTPQYMAMDPEAKALRARLAELEDQYRAQREDAQKSALAEAEEEAASAREAVRRLQQQLSDDRQSVQRFAASFHNYKALQDDLSQLESLHRDAKERLVKLEASERARNASMQVLQAATPPQEPVSPAYLRDAGLGVAGALVLALVATWLVEWFRRDPPQPVVLVPQLRTPPPVELLGADARRPAELARADQELLSRPAALPRELTDPEAATLLTVATPDARLAMLALLQGVGPDELVSWRWSHLGLADRKAFVPSDPPRTVALTAPLCRALESRSSDLDEAGAWILQDGQARPYTVAELDALILCAAHDAGLDGAVTSAVLRHTYLAFLVRQGIRFSDLPHVVGRLPAETLASYSALAPSGARLPLDAIDLILPAVRRLGLGEEVIDG